MSIVFIKHMVLYLLMPNILYYYDTSIISPVGNLIGNITSPGILVFSLQCINVSSKSNTIVFLLVGGKLTLFSSIIDYNVGYIVLEY